MGWSILLLILMQSITAVLSQDCSFAEGASLVEPAYVTSSKPKWRVTLRAQPDNFTVDWLSLERRTYNGSVPAPTIRVKQGDQLEILLINNLPTADKGGKLNELRFPDSTNLHLHGLHIDSKVPGDNVLIRIKPGQSYLYTYKIEDDQPAGTYWYHPHLHGSTILQVNSGMAGMLIVEDSKQATNSLLRAVTCPFNCKHDIELLFQPMLTYVNAADAFVKIQNESHDTLRGITSNRAGCPPLAAGQTKEDWLARSSGLNHFTTNGLLNPVLTIETGQMKRFRMVNAGGSEILEIEMVNNNTGLHSCEYKEIALDGVYLDKPRKPRQNKTLLVPAGRTDWLVRCNKPGTYIIRSLALEVDTNSTGNITRRFNGTLFTVSVTGSSKTGTIGNVPLPTRPHYVNFGKTDLTTSFSIEVGPQLTLNRERFKGEHYFRHLVYLKETVQWNFLNTDPKDGHPIHIHVNHFKIVGYERYTGPIGQTITTKNGKKSWLLFSPDSKLDNRVCKYQHEKYEAADGKTEPSDDINLSYPHHEKWDKDEEGTVGYSQAGDYRDTLMVPPLSNITIQFMVHKFTDIVVIHCHFLHHEDQGMMMLVDIIDKEEGDNTTVMPKSGNALPGQCMSESGDSTATQTDGSKPKPCNGSGPQHVNGFHLMILCFLSVMWW